MAESPIDAAETPPPARDPMIPGGWSPIALSRPSTVRWATVGLLALSFAIGALQTPLVFDTNDDAAMLGISAGYFGEGVGDPRLVYQSAFIGSLLGVLFRWTTAFDWYSALQWSLCVLAHATILRVLLRSSSSRAHWIAVAFTTLALLPPILFRIQFTQTAFACIAAGLVLLVDLGRRRRRGLSARGIVLGRLAAAAGFFLLAGALRASTLPVGLTLVLVAGAVLAAGAARSGGRRDVASVLLAAIAFVLVVQATHLGLGRLEERLFYADDAWREFHRHHAERAFVLENWPRWIGVERISTALQAELGVTAEELAAMARWIPVDSRLYSIEGFREMAGVVRSIESEGPFQPARLGESLRALAGFLAATPLFVAALIWIAAFAVLRAVLEPSARVRMLSLGALFVLLPLAFWLQVDLLFRPPPYRVWLPFLAVDAWLFLALAASAPAGAADPGTAAAAGDAPADGPGALESTFAGGGADASTGARAGDPHVRWALTGLVATLVAAFPLHLEVGQVLLDRVADRPNDCAMTAAHLWALDQRPPGAQAFVAPLVIHSECFVNPFRVAMPETLLRDAQTFGWRNLLPPVHEALFANGPSVFDAICARSDNMLVLHPSQRIYLDHYLARHRPDLRFERYSDRLPPAVLACRPVSGEAGGGSLLGRREAR
jgi:hypothetical protein